ncbi:MAG TPA: hypothetical protein VF103_02625 [Polyangiaceae bacterium]
MAREGVILLAWCGAAFALQTAFALSTLGGFDASVLVVYALGLAATFPLHRKTRTPGMMVVAFGLVGALCVEGIRFALVAEDVALSKRLATSSALAVPLLALVVRRWARGEEDDWFARSARRVVPVALLVAVPLLVAGVLGSRRSDPAPYARARRALGYNPLELLVFEGVEYDRQAHGRSRWTALQTADGEGLRDIRAEVNRRCEGFSASDPERASLCADELLSTRYRTLERYRDGFRALGLASAVPWAIAALFAWRGRRERPGVHALPTE